MNNLWILKQIKTKKWNLYKFAINHKKTKSLKNHEINAKSKEIYMCFLIKFKTNINLSKTVIHLEILNQYEKNNELLTKPQLIYKFITKS